MMLHLRFTKDGHVETKHFNDGLKRLPGWTGYKAFDYEFKYAKTVSTLWIWHNEVRLTSIYSSVGKSKLQKADGSMNSKPPIKVEDEALVQLYLMNDEVKVASIHIHRSRPGRVTNAIRLTDHRGAAICSFATDESCFSNLKKNWETLRLGQNEALFKFSMYRDGKITVRTCCTTKNFKGRIRD